MSIALVRLVVILPLTIFSSIALSVWIGVGGCTCTSYSIIIMMCAASLAIMHRPASYASVSDVMTCLIIC